jgi:hypothetical protein
MQSSPHCNSMAPEKTKVACNPRLVLHAMDRQAKGRLNIIARAGLKINAAWKANPRL